MFDLPGQVPVLIFVCAAPEGLLAAHFELEDDRTYHPEDVTVLTEVPPRGDGQTLTVTCTRLPDHAEFREMAVSAATRAARVETSPAGQWLKLLIPF
ncbi:hypothetical protein [Deinococcus pimensis]|uniref:hypothetical protein n=1 Tax=Deinococcus pimensis TaxID=309888 RepID=UPI0004885AD5|nr:hypothetical protein [Deinococcus pimensis]